MLNLNAAFNNKSFVPRVIQIIPTSRGLAQLHHLHGFKLFLACIDLDLTYFSDFPTQISYNVISILFINIVYYLTD